VANAANVKKARVCVESLREGIEEGMRFRVAFDFDQRKQVPVLDLERKGGWRRFRFDKGNQAMKMAIHDQRATETDQIFGRIGGISMSCKNSVAKARRSDEALHHEF
jgi:hypothetical protein